METKNRFANIVAVLIALVTLFASVLAYLQSDAGGRDAQANRDSIRYALEAFGERVGGDARVNYEYNIAYQTLYENQVLANSAANREDLAASKRYETLANETSKLGSLLNEPYYKPGGSESPQVSRYEADAYLVKVTELMEKYMAATAVKEAWDYKANTYIIHITMLAIALFLFGLATTIASDKNRWIFSITGVAISIIAVIWAATLFLQPVFDLREQGKAISHYANGVGLAHQEKYTEALQAFDLALTDYPAYTNALAEKAAANFSLGNYDLAIQDYQKAINSGDSRANTAGQLAYAYYLTGQFDKGAEMDRSALLANPEELWLQFDLGSNLLASGKMDEATAVYEKAVQQASTYVDTVKQSGGEPPSFIWSAMEDSADTLDGLIYTIESGSGTPPKDKITNPDAVLASAQKMMAKIKSTALALEYTGKPPAAELKATLTPLAFAEPVKDENGEVTGYGEPADNFENGLDEFGVIFDYQGISKGSDVIVKLYINGNEDPSWRIVEKWDGDENGTITLPISYAYSDTFTFQPGEYVVEVYVDYNLAQRGMFTINE